MQNLAARPDAHATAAAGWIAGRVAPDYVWPATAIARMVQRVHTQRVKCAADGGRKTSKADDELGCRALLCRANVQRHQQSVECPHDPETRGHCDWFRARAARERQRCERDGNRAETAMNEMAAIHVDPLICVAAHSAPKRPFSATMRGISRLAAAHMLQNLSIDSFRSLVGTEFAVNVDTAHEIALRLDRVDSLTERHGIKPLKREPFALTFSGPAAPLLAQQIVPMRHITLGALAIFVVPLGVREERAIYEAIFT